MRFNELRISNFGVFQGSHVFRLLPDGRVNGVAEHPVIVVNGHNGAGKSTLYQAFALALYGPLSLGRRTSKDAYLEYLASRLHKGADVANPPQAGAVSLTISYIASGRQQILEITRAWSQAIRGITDTISILQNGEPPDVEPEDYQYWLNSLIDPGLAPLMFFDAEQLEKLSLVESPNYALRDLLYQLLSLDLIDLLDGDLRFLITKSGGNRTEAARESVKHFQAELDEIASQLVELERQMVELTAQIRSTEDELNKNETTLAEQGGNYASRRPLLQERYQELDNLIGQLEEQAREMATGLLPFALVPDLCIALKKQLTAEVELQKIRLAEELWNQRLEAVTNTLDEDITWRGISISTDDRNLLNQRLLQILNISTWEQAAQTEDLIHNLAQPDYERLHMWIEESVSIIPRKATHLGESIKTLRSEKDTIQRQLQRVPDEAVLKPIFEEVTRLQVTLNRLRAMASDLERQIGVLHYKRDEVNRRLDQAAQDLFHSQADTLQVDLAEKSRIVLQTYRDVLLQQRLPLIEQYITDCFNKLCQKDSLISSCRIDVATFDLFLNRRDGRPISIQELSAGEKQLLAFAILWALRQASGRQIPLLVDTPLARLDKQHRERLVRDYFPQVSDQVILFTTDAETDKEHFGVITPFIDHQYRLSYDGVTGSTSVTRFNTDLVG